MGVKIGVPHCGVPDNGELLPSGVLLGDNGVPRSGVAGGREELSMTPAVTQMTEDFAGAPLPPPMMAPLDEIGAERPPVTMARLAASS